jgi:antitoxin FitA
VTSEPFLILVVTGSSRSGDVAACRRRDEKAPADELADKTRFITTTRSMEAEVRAILTDAVAEPGQSPDLFHTLMDRFGELGGVELDLPPRATRPRAAEFA